MCTLRSPKKSKAFLEPVFSKGQDLGELKSEISLLTKSPPESALIMHAICRNEFLANKNGSEASTFKISSDE